MSASNNATFFTPTTCFTVACVAFSLVALSTIWRNSQAIHTTSVAKKEHADKPLPASHAFQRRVAAQSPDGEPDDEEGDSRGMRAYLHKPAISHGPRSQIAQVLLLGARVTELLRACHEAPVLAVNLLGQLSLITACLAQLQQEVFVNPTFLDRVGLAACFGAVNSALQASLLSLEESLSRDTVDAKELKEALQQLKDQRPVLDYLLSNTYSSFVPPTPPSEAVVEETLKNSHTSNAHSALPCSYAAPEGVTPSTEQHWSEPPPQYSPPADTRSRPPPEKPNKQMTAQYPESGPAHTDNALYEAVNENDSKSLADLLTRGADCNAQFGDLQRTALHQAAHLNHSECLTKLLQHGASIAAEDAKGDTAIHLAAWAGHIEALSTLLAHGAEIDRLSGRDGYSPLWCSISAHQIDAARLLLKHNARVNLRAASGSGLTPLHQAAVTGQAALCDLLVQRGALVDALDDDANTPLHYAAACGSVGCVQTLLHAGADVEARQTQGLGAVHWAAHKGHEDVLAVLVEQGARVEGRAERGATPLHLAASRGHEAAVRLLLEKGAERDVGVAAWDGLEGTPAEMATWRGYEGVASLLRT